MATVKRGAVRPGRFQDPFFRKDAGQRTIIVLDDPEWIARRHGLGEAATPLIRKMKSLLAGIAAEAAASG